MDITPAVSDPCYGPSCHPPLKARLRAVAEAVVADAPRGVRGMQIHREAAAPAPNLPPAIGAMFADWGKTGSPHDLDADGTVGMRDFFDLMRQLSEAPNKAQVEALFRDWGRSDSSPHDLTGDGTVGIQDFFKLMAMMYDAARPQESAQSAPDDPAAPVIAAAESTTEPSLTEEAAAEPAEVVAPTTAPQPADDSPVGRPRDLLAPVRAAYGLAMAENFARSVMPLINDPDDLRESLENSRLPAHGRRHVLDRLGAWNPRGLTFTAVG